MANKPFLLQKNFFDNYLNKHVSIFLSTENEYTGELVEVDKNNNITIITDKERIVLNSALINFISVNR